MSVALSALANQAQAGASATEILNKAKANDGAMMKGAVGQALEKSPYGWIVLRAIDILDGVVSVKYNIDTPNGAQTVDFVDRLVSNFGALVACYAYDYSRSDAWARQKTTLLLWDIARSIPCDSRIGLCYGFAAGAFPGKKAGTSCVKYWRKRWQLIEAGELAPVYMKYNLKNGKPISTSLKYCKGGITAELVDEPSKKKVQFVPDWAKNIDYKKLEAAAKAVGQTQDFLTSKPQIDTAIAISKAEKAKPIVEAEAQTVAVATVSGLALLGFA
tara:strand:- start:289 stop:1107 length:819 start_codon:yes stop_codon:yes gene_type:complete